MQKPQTSYNPFFLVPFVIWVITGGVLQLIYTQEELFRVMNGSHSGLLDITMSYTTYLGEGAVITVVLLVLLFMVPMFRNWWYFTAALASNILPSIVVQTIKRSLNAPRPLNVFNEASWIHILPDWPRHMSNSFPSGHTCGAFTFFTFLAVLLMPKHKYWGLLLFILGVLVAYSRVYLAVHFFKDVYAGSIIGVVATLAIVAIMNRYKSLFFKKAQ